ncbi:glutamine synthetase family protein [Actinomadura alba]|uniref:Glutamine synthetase n=1 Tax=Actinomadura alba TaxID=406431 RepID=A0ABR7LWJ1_9ACTN|nr:glutamine synthetase family protein [Actinomadura alba]MBC6469216.1 glutamine synthetase [Actinomadura alba]
MGEQRVVERATVENAELIRFLYADHDGVIRGKATTLTRLGQRMRSGIGHTVGMMAMSMLDLLQPVEGAGPVGEVRIVPDPSTFTMLPYAPGAAAMCADLVRLDGRPWEACARTFLKDAVAELAADGTALRAAFEPEFTLGRRVPGPAGGPDRLEPLDDSACYSATGFHLAHEFALDLVRALQAQGLEPELYYPEYGHGQQELSVRHAPALRAADNHVLYRETVRALAFQRGLWASMAAKPIPDQIGNGCHLHASLWSLDGSRNLFHDGGDPHGLSETGYHFIGGLLAHLPALMAFTAATVNSYRRLVPGAWSSAYACYGMDNREAAVRICSPMGDDVAGSTNLELKPSDSGANPYLALGAYIHAGLDGVRNRTDPGEAVGVDPATLTDEERERRGVRRLPVSLEEALDALEGDPLLMDALGPLRREAYLAVKRSDIAEFAGHDAAFECFHHFARF